MTKTENIILNSVKERVIYYQKNNFDKYIILDYIYGSITLMHSKISDKLLSQLFDICQEVMRDKEVKIGG